MLEIWTEKYRPQTLNEVINQKHIVERLKVWIKEGSIPNMLFAGSAGTGKTTIALCLAKESFKKYWRENFSETNASVAPETPIMIRKNGTIRRTNFRELAKEYFTASEKYASVKDLEIMSIDKDYKAKFIPVSTISRHKVNKIAKIKYEGGIIRTSLNHSIILIDGNGNLVSKRVDELDKGDLLITFKTSMQAKNPVLDFDKYRPKMFVNFENCSFKNPKIKTVIENMELNEELAWIFGMYLAEGCAHLRKSGTNGVVIFTLSYPAEMKIVNRIEKMLKDNFNLSCSKIISPSGFKLNSLSSMQLRTWNTQLSKFFLENFYDGSLKKEATTKRVPHFVYQANLQNKIAFLKGYMGDACGKWKEYLRYSSRSKENLIDIAWLGRISGMDTSCFDSESRIIWKLHSFSYIKSEFMPAEPIIKLFDEMKLKGNKYRYLFRHQLYSKKSKRISKHIAKKFLEEISNKFGNKKIQKLLKLINSPLSVVKIKEIKVEGYDDYVYDVSVPNVEMFFGGTTPILLHNSDERGIDVVRGKIKNFARTKPIASDFKIIFLDESDALTPEAQQALRRTMERFSSVCRFILSANYSSRIIEPIQSRCSVFRFKKLTEKEVKEYLERIVKAEKLKVADDAFKAIFEISQGDLRKATNILQACSTFTKITRKEVYEVVAKAKPEDVKEMLDLALKGKFEPARKKLYDMLINKGLAPEDIIKAIHAQTFDLPLPEQAKLELIEKIGEFEFRLNQGSSPEIQILALLTQFLKYKGKG